MNIAISILISILVGLLSLAAAAAVIWYIGVYLLMGIVLATFLFVMWALGHGLRISLKGQKWKRE